MDIGGDVSLQIKTFGRFEVALNDVPISDNRWPRRRTKELLKLLVTAPGQPFASDQIVDALLPDSDVEGATANIQARISELRRVLEPGLVRGRDSRFIVNAGEGYAFAPACECLLDTQAFEAGLAESRHLAEGGCWKAATERLERALLLYRGEFLAEDRYAEWAEGPRSRLRERYLDGLDSLAECYAKLGQLHQAITCCQRILGVEPHRENIVRRLMELQHRIGQRGKALDAFNEGVRALREHLDVGPSPETVALRERIASSEGLSGDELDPRRIAVLPFVNYGAAAEDEYLADGMTEELIGHLSRIRDLRVVARTSVMRFKGATGPLVPIARELRAGTLLEGSVRRAGEEIRISAQLIHAVTEDHLWASEYSGSTGDLLGFQRDVAGRVAESLQVVLAQDEAQPPEPRRPKTPEAYSLYLRGQVLLGRLTVDSCLEALPLFQKAAKLDPKLALAHVGVGRCYSYLAGWEAHGSKIPLAEGYGQAKRALLRALEVDPTLADAHAALGLVQAMFERRFADAEASYRRAIHLNPSSSDAHVWYSLILIYMNRIDEGVAEARCAVDLDPVSAWCHMRLAFNYVQARRLGEARSTIEQGLKLDPSYSQLYDVQARMHWLQWEWGAAQQAVEKYVSAAPYPFDRPWSRGLHALYCGRVEESLAEFGSIAASRLGDRRFRLTFGIALYHAREYGRVVSLMDELITADPFGIVFAGKSWLYLLRGLALEQLGRDGEALSALERARVGLPEWLYYTFSRGPILADTAEALIRVRNGQEEDALRMIRKLTERSKEAEVASALAVLSFHVGRLAEGFSWLETALEHHDDLILTIKTHPWFDPIREESRFSSVLKRMHLTG
jgi:DNA-binding SARP family transcriptional activator